MIEGLSLTHNIKFDESVIGWFVFSFVFVGICMVASALIRAKGGV